MEATCTIDKPFPRDFRSLNLREKEHLQKRIKLFYRTTFYVSSDFGLYLLQWVWLANVRRRMLVDVDECGIALEKCNQSYGYAHSTIRVRKPGHYTKGKKLTVIAAIEPGDPTLPPNVDGRVLPILGVSIEYLLRVEPIRFDFLILLMKYYRTSNNPD
jgi:hypothetical protein